MKDTSDKTSGNHPPHDARPAARELSAITVGDGRLSALNPAWETVLGTPPADLAGKPFLALFEDGDRDRVRAASARAASGETVPALELPTRRRDGAFVWIAWTLSAADEGAVRVRGRDVTAVRVQRAEQAAAARFAEVGSVAAIVAHDLNNVLTLIRSSAYMLRQSAGLPSEHLRELDDLDAGVRHGTELVREVIDHCRRPMARTEEADLNQVVVRMAWMLRQIGRKNVHVDFRFARGLGRAKADESVVGQAILNLAVNARDAMPHGGRLVVETEETELESSPDPRRPIDPGRYVALSVSDTGTGIPPEARARLYEPFFTTKPAGTGLGLYAVKRAVERSGGVIGVRTGPTGTRFTLYFPRLSD